ncbi:MAG: winged helix-turn-helix domain-containing protein [Ardenticatenaceae bacterium]|nr:winged helix-turn-helix domain-containing protein [Anaerolineales bacterium]MCB8921562.1 winged helix-turn-helix domain-containing protein [Ardenticatenaceae bacterium]MCB8991479.1 winged helix-turn-helix domain-containing protein [Ardenticatenaceae bacterium]MCB9003901.1 winged helix-turn-helix domain-containing protein [Ardenticatenaceae bacterium]
MDAIASLFTHTGDGACTLDEHQQITSWNVAATKLLGYEQSEALGQKCWELLMGRTPQGQSFCKPDCAVRSRLNDNKSIASFDMLVRHRSGKRVLINVSTIPIPHETNNGKSKLLVHLWRLRNKPAVAKHRLRIYLLGVTTVTLGNGTVINGALWNRVKVRALLAHLAIQEGQPVSRERLIETLWPDLPYQAALHNLNTTVYNLRRSLEPELKKTSESRYILYQNGHYYLADAEAHWVDVRAFEEGIRQARTLTRHIEKIDAYKTTLALYRGDYLMDLDATGVWSSGEQVRYRLLYLAAMEELGASFEEAGLDDEAREWYGRILALDACRENTAQRLIHLLMRQGRRTEALAQCHKLATALEEELNVMLSEETNQLMARIRQTT